MENDSDNWRRGFFRRPPVNCKGTENRRETGTVPEMTAAVKRTVRGDFSRHYTVSSSLLSIYIPPFFLFLVPPRGRFIILGARAGSKAPLEPNSPDSRDLLRANF